MRRCLGRSSLFRRRRRRRRRLGFLCRRVVAQGVFVVIRFGGDGSVVLLLRCLSRCRCRRTLAATAGGASRLGCAATVDVVVVRFLVVCVGGGSCDRPNGRRRAGGSTGAGPSENDRYGRRHDEERRSQGPNRRRGRSRGCGSVVPEMAMPQRRGHAKRTCCYLIH